MLKGEKSILDELSYRRKAMDSEYSHWEPHFKELRDAILPSRGRFETTERRSDSSINKRIIDSTAAMSLRALGSGLMAGMTSPSRPWFRLGLHGMEARNDPKAKEYLHEAEKRLYTVLRGSNVYQMLRRCYDDLGLFGTFGGMIVPDFENVVHAHSFQMGSYRIGDNGTGDIISLHRKVKMTVAGVVEMFGEDKVSNHVRQMFKSGAHFETVTVCHAVERRRDGDATSILPRNKPWASYYWEDTATDTFLMISGHSVNPLLVPRWDEVPGEAWSASSPGMMALGDALQLQVQQRDKGMAIQLSYKPMLQSSGMPNLFVRSVPGGVTTVNTQDLQRGGLRPVHEVKPDINGLVMDIQETQRRIETAFFKDLFLMTSVGIAGRSQVTAAEIAERHEEKLLQLGPVLESLDHGLLQPLIEATFHFMQEADILPPAPESIVGRPVKVEYISLLAQAQRAIGVGAIERTIGFAGTLAQIKPEVLDLLDGETAMREFADYVGPPPALLHTPDEVEQNRAARAEQQAQQSMIENAQPMAQAAKLISEANMMGAEALQRGAAL